jgi:hypothetical protein
MTSLIKETGRLAGQMKCFRRRAAYEVASALGRRQRLVSRARLEAAIASEPEPATTAVPSEPEPAATAVATPVTP